MPRRPIAFTLLLWFTAGCTSWRVQNLTPQQVIDKWHPASVRVTRADSSQVVFEQPRMAEGDSLVGLVQGAPSGIPVSDVTHVAIRRISAGKTLGLIWAIDVVVGIIVLAVGGVNVCCSSP